MVGTVGLSNLTISDIPNQVPERPAVTWVPPTFENTNVIEPGKSAWVFVTSGTIVPLTFGKGFSSESKAKAVPMITKIGSMMVASSTDEWNLTISAANQLEPVTFGIHSGATNGYDGYDVFSQTPVQGKVIMVLDDIYAIEINRDELIWHLDIGVPAGQTTTLMWDSSKIPADVSLTLNGTDMKSQDSVELGEGSHSFVINAEYTTPPASITNLQNTAGTTHLNWTWTNPPDPDFNHTEIYLNGVFQTITSSEHYNATDLAPETSYIISTRTVDTSGNINATWVNDTATTLSGADTTPPTVEIISPKEGWVNASVCIRLNFIAEGPSGIDWIGYSLDGGDNVTIAGNITIGGLGAGSHNITVYVNDTAGNENSSDTVSFTLHPGDISGDSVVNVYDLRGLAAAFLSVPGAGNWNQRADLNCDGGINVLDLRILANNFFNTYE